MDVHEAENQGYYVTVPDSEEPIHDRSDPLTEAQERLPATLPDHERFIVMGAGLGYVLKQIKDHCEEPKVLVAEPLPEVLEQGRERSIWNEQDFSQWDVVHPGTSNLLDRIHQFIPVEVFDKYVLVEWPSYESRFPEFFERVRVQIKGLKRYQKVDLKTLETSGTTWLKNTCKNIGALTNLRRCPDIPSDQNVVVVGAGPSLNDQVDWIRKHSNNCITFAVNTAGPVLEHYEIEVDFHFGMDARPVIYEDLSRSNPNRLLVSPYSDPRILKRFEQRPASILALSTPFTDWWTTAPFLREISTRGAGLPTLLQWILELEPATIYLAGCDLQEQNGRYYARGTYRETRECQRLTRFYSLTSWHLRKIRGEQDQSALQKQRTWIQ
ncbi:MAG: 6-hydroxymethylpterin diphosphokinase MptE-like protein, partial [bacterium]